MGRLIVIALERACGLIHTLNLPVVRNHYGCRLVAWSEALDRRWGTRIWDE